MSNLPSQIAVQQTVFNNSMAASARAEAQKAKCRFILKEDPRDMQVGQLQEYGDCIDLLYPQKMTDAELASAKWFVLFMLVFTVIGSGYMIRKECDKSDGILDHFMFGLIGATFGFIAGALLVGAFAVIAFLFR